MVDHEGAGVAGRGRPQVVEGQGPSDIRQVHTPTMENPIFFFKIVSHIFFSIFFRFEFESLLQNFERDKSKNLEILRN